MPRDLTKAKEPVKAVRVIRTSRTLPVSIVVEGDDGELYQLPLERQNQQPDVYARTWICGIAAVAVGLPINPQRIVILPDRMVRELVPHACPDQEKFTMGSATTVLADLIVGPRVGSLRTFSFLPQCNVKYVKNKQDFIGMHLFDIWIERGVARRVVFSRTGRSRDIRASFVNDGSVLAGQQCSRQAIYDSLRRQHHLLYEGLSNQAQAESWHSLFRDAMPEALSLAVASMPKVWEAYGSHETLCERLTVRLQSLEMMATACPLPEAALWSVDLRTSRAVSASATVIA